MLKRIATIFVVILLLPVFVSAQEHSILKPDGKIVKHKGELRDLKDQSGKQHKSEIQKNYVQDMPALVSSPDGTIDTLRLPTTDFTTFGYSGGDVMLQWFVAPADMDITHVGFSCAGNAAGNSVEVKIVSLNWPIDSVFNAPVVHRGWYPADNPDYNNITAFIGDLTNAGDWLSIDGSSEPFGDDIWSDGGQGATVTPVAANSATYTFVAMIDLGEPSLLQGDIFGIAVKHNGPLDEDQMVIHAQTLGVGGMKFYANGRLVSGGPGVGDPGWWTREFSFNMVAVVNLTGDRAPVISDVTTLGTTLSTDPRTVSATIIDDNPSGGAFGVASATLQYSLDGGTIFTDVTMVAAGDVYSADIPGQAAGQEVVWQITTTDVEGLSSATLPATYNIFAKVHDVLLILNNTGDFATSTSKRLYLGNPGNSLIVDPVENDVWTSADGTLEATIVMSNYQWVIEIGGSFPDIDFSDNVKAYLDGATAGNERNYFLSSQDYGCFITGDCLNMTFTAGDFQYDYLGIETLGPQDLPGGIVGLEGVASDPISGWVAQYVADSGYVYYYDSGYELGFTQYIDALTPISGATATFMSDGQVVGVRNEGANWKTGFLGYDYAATNFRSDTSVTDHSDEGYAWGIFTENQALKFLEWSGYVVGVERENNLLPNAYSLSQNYPNPFNPSTTIKFSVPEQSNVVLKVYDILGSEVANLVNETLDAGNYTANFDASKFASGMYIYRLTAGNFVTTKKMMLLK